MAIKKSTNLNIFVVVFSFLILFSSHKANADQNIVPKIRWGISSSSSSVGGGGGGPATILTKKELTRHLQNKFSLKSLFSAPGGSEVHQMMNFEDSWKEKDKEQKTRLYTFTLVVSAFFDGQHVLYARDMKGVWKSIDKKDLDNLPVSYNFQIDFEQKINISFRFLQRIFKVNNVGNYNSYVIFTRYVWDKNFFMKEKEGYYYLTSFNTL